MFKPPKGTILIRIYAREPVELRGQPITVEVRTYAVIAYADLNGTTLHMGSISEKDMIKLSEKHPPISLGYVETVRGTIYPELWLEVQHA